MRVPTSRTERHGLALAMAETLERGETRLADDIRKEREDVLGQLRQGAEAMDERGLAHGYEREHGRYLGIER